MGSGTPTAGRSLRSLLFAAAVHAACAAGAPPAPDPGSSGPELGALVERYFDDYLALNPVEATLIGDYRFNHRLGNPLSRAYLEAADHLDRRYLEALSAVDAARLDPGGRIVLGAFRWRLENALATRASGDHFLPLRHVAGFHSVFAQMGTGEGIHPFATLRDYHEFLARASQFPLWVDAAIGNMREGLALGIVHPCIVVERVVPQLEAQLVDDPMDSPFYGPVLDVPDAINGATWRVLRAEYAGLIAGRLVPAYRHLLEFLRKDYLPGCRAEPGMASLPGGASWYAHLVRHHTTLDVAPEEIHALGLREVTRLHERISQVMRETGYHGSLAGFFEFMAHSEAFHVEDPGRLLDEYAGVRARIEAALPRLFHDPPAAALEIRPMGGIGARSAPIAQYVDPSADGSRGAVIYVNTESAHARARYRIPTTFLHEGVPGHHLQTAQQIRRSGLPRFLRFGHLTAFSEGWAVYAETLGHELGVFTDPYERFGQLEAELLRALRLVLDTGIHAGGWSREQAIDYLLANSSLHGRDAAAEVERCIALPAHGLAYTLGLKRIQALRERARVRLGSRFDPRGFHEAVLRHGTLPLPILQEAVDAWIDTAAADPA
jgi:uncharacterized protein (DUF885 family)